VLNYLGIISVGGISIATGGKAEFADTERGYAGVLGRKLADAISNGFPDPAQEAIIADNRGDFRGIVEENRDFRPEDYERWVKMGWID